MTSPVPSKIKAVLQPDIESIDLILTTLPTQLAKEGTDEHLVKVYATAPCAGELLWAKNAAAYAKLVPNYVPVERDNVPCYDLSGVVVTAPPNSPFQPGTAVWTRTSAARAGNAREYTVAHTDELAVKPANLSWEEAASIPLSLFTAYQALFVHGGLAKGWKDAASRAANAEKRVLITAGAGGVGVIAVQLAKAAGAKDIVAISGPDNVEFVKILGATEVINYKQQSLGEWAKKNEKVDLVFDMLGRQTLKDSWTAVKDGGKLIGIFEPPEVHRPTENAPHIEAKFFIMEPTGEQLDDVKDLVEAGGLKPVVDSVWSLAQFQGAFDKVASGHARGKVIIKIVE